jgi:subtilisin-like proprotein convertase family protein
MADPIVVTASATPNAVIPDGNLAGLSSSITLSSLAAQSISVITSVSVTVNIVGDAHAWNGDYYAYLQYGPDLVVLLNQLGVPGNGGFGSSGNGMDVTFSAGATSINSSPANAELGTPSVPVTYAPVGNLNAFDGLTSATSGAWTLFIADTSSGGVGELDNWSLTVTGLPDNGSTLLLLTMGVGLLGLCSLRAPKLLS